MSKHFGIGAKFPMEEARLYRKLTVVPMARMDEPFTCDSREGHRLQGQAGDYLAEDGHGGFYPISAEFHEAHYEEAVQCFECSGSGYFVVPDCCGNVWPSGACKGECAVPRQVPCDMCGGSGAIEELRLAKREESA